MLSVENFIKLCNLELILFTFFDHPEVKPHQISRQDFIHTNYGKCNFQFILKVNWYWNF